MEQPILSQNAPARISLTEAVFNMSTSHPAILENGLAPTPLYTRAFHVVSAITIGESLGLYGKDKAALKDLEQFSGIPLTVLKDLQRTHASQRRLMHGDRRFQTMMFEKQTLEDRISNLLGSHTRILNDLIYSDSERYASYTDYKQGFDDAVERWEELKVS